MKCPKCGGTLLYVECTITVTYDGAESPLEYGEPSHNLESFVICGNDDCEYEGTINDFTSEGNQEGERNAQRG